MISQRIHILCLRAFYCGIYDHPGNRTGTLKVPDTPPPPTPTAGTRGRGGPIADVLRELPGY